MRGMTEIFSRLQKTNVYETKTAVSEEKICTYVNVTEIKHL